MKFEPWTTAYKFLNKRILRLLPQFEDLGISLKKSGTKITYKAYVSFMLLTSVVVFAVAIMFLPFLLPLTIKIEFLSIANLILSLMFACLAAVFSLILIYVYPGMKASNRNGPIENNLPYVTSFLTLLSSSNVPPSIIFRSLARIDTLREVRQEFSNILRDVEIFGKDLMSSILDNANYTPNKKLREVLIGYVATVRTGGNPTEYLRASAENITRERISKLDAMLESLSAIAEIYVLVLVAMPLLFVVLFSTLGMLGGGGTQFNPGFFLYLLTYLGIPIMGAIMIVVTSTFEK